MYLIAFAGLAMVFLVYFFFSKTRELYIIARVKAAGNKVTETYDNGGSVYYGQWEGGKYGGRRCGYGTMTWVSGSKYVGEWKDDKMHGQGIETLANGTIKHSGEWENGYPKK